MISHPDFKLVWPDLIERLRIELRRSDPMRPVYVAFYCKVGKHRSVALAWTLTNILRQEPALNVELWHTMREYWNFGSCRECAECATDSREKLALLANIRPGFDMS